MEEDLVIDRSGQVWVGELDGQGAYLLLHPRGEDYTLERYDVLDLESGHVGNFITCGIENSHGWVRYR